MRINSVNDKIIMCDEEDLMCILSKGDYSSTFREIKSYIFRNNLKNDKKIYDVGFIKGQDEISDFVWECYDLLPNIAKSRIPEGVINRTNIIEAYIYALENDDQIKEILLRDIIKKKEQLTTEEFFNKYGISIVSYILEHSYDKEILLYENGTLNVVISSDINNSSKLCLENPNQNN